MTVQAVQMLRMTTLLSLATLAAESLAFAAQPLHVTSLLLFGSPTNMIPGEPVSIRICAGHRPSLPWTLPVTFPGARMSFKSALLMVAETEDSIGRARAKVHLSRLERSFHYHRYRRTAVSTHCAYCRVVSSLLYIVERRGAYNPTCIARMPAIVRLEITNRMPAPLATTINLNASPTGEAGPFRRAEGVRGTWDSLDLRG